MTTQAEMLEQAEQEIARLTALLQRNEKYYHADRRALQLRLRDKFAIAVLTGRLTNGSYSKWEDVASEAYEIADVMLKAREATPDAQEATDAPSEP